MREWSPAAQTGTLRWLANVIKQQPPVSEVELWIVRKESASFAVSCATGRLASTFG
jgi:hypothetical protein